MHLLKLTPKIWLSKMIKSFFWKPHKKRSSCVFWKGKSQIRTYFDSQSHSSYNKNKGVKTSVPKFCGIFCEFLEILPGFLTNQNFWGCACTPLHPRPLHHCQNWPRDQVLRLHYWYAWSGFFLRFRFGDRKEILRDRLEEFERPFSIDVTSGHYVLRDRWGNLRDRFGPSKHLKKTLHMVLMLVPNKLACN